MAHGFDRWLLVQTQSKREEWAAENVARQGHQFYLPKLLKRISKNSNQGLLIWQPLFPRYLFVLVHGPWSFLMSTFGVTGVVMSGESPAVVPERLISELKAREDQSGFIELPRKSHLKENTRVRVTKGPFERHVGIYKGSSASERERVLLDVLGGRREVLIDRTDIEPC